jgi:hypothetical protein
VGGWVWWVWGCGGGFPLRSNIPRSALCATLDTYNFSTVLQKIRLHICCVALHELPFAISIQ